MTSLRKQRRELCSRLCFWNVSPEGMRTFIWGRRSCRQTFFKGRRLRAYQVSLSMLSQHLGASPFPRAKGEQSIRRRRVSHAVWSGEDTVCPEVPLALLPCTAIGLGSCSTAVQTAWASCLHTASKIPLSEKKISKGESERRHSLGATECMLKLLCLISSFGSRKSYLLFISPVCFW